MKLSSSPRRRKQAGAWLRDLREEAGLTQVELAKRLGLKYYAFVSQVETGLSRVPTEKLERWARALHARPPAFAKQLISFYEPELYRLLFLAPTRRAPPQMRASHKKQRPPALPKGAEAQPPVKRE